MTRIIYAALLLALASGCAATKNPVGLYQPSQAGNLLKPFSGKLNADDLSIGSISIGTSTFDEVAAKFGKTEIIKSDQEQSWVRICYRSVNKGDDTIVLFESGPMGGWTRLTSISITHSKLWKDSALCQSSRLVTKEISTVSGLKIGISTSELVRRLGNPSVITENFYGRYLLSQEGDWTTTSVVEAALENDQLVSITLHQIITN
ncbi:MAG: hypothetical protein JKY01_08375 [Pseudomonadales bacterium]|nr:hypothetical protein [Pseudomonadales bacterium]